MTPLVSIIIPVYNAEKHLKECLESALNQSWAEKEIILVDDGSSDNSLSIAEAFSSGALKIIRQKNSGASAARNNGLQASKGQYIQFLDADDLLSSDKIEKQVVQIDGSDSTLAVCSTVHFYNKEDLSQLKPNEYEERFIYSTDNTLDFLIRLWGGYDNEGSMVQPNAWLTPRSLITKAGNWNENLSLDDDGEFFARIIAYSTRIIKTDGLNYYRKHKSGNNLSSTTTHKGLKSLLESALSKKDILLSRTNQYEARFAIQRLLQDVAMQSFPQYPDVVRQAEINYPGITLPAPHLGGRALDTLARVFGWKFAKKIQILLK